MFYRILVVLGLVIFGLSGCKSASDGQTQSEINNFQSLADRIVTRDGFQTTFDVCRAKFPDDNPAECLSDTYESIVKTYCSEAKLSAGECSDLNSDVRDRLIGYSLANREKRLGKSR
jgi:hypothetical protein